MWCVLTVVLLCAAVYNVKGAFNNDCTDLNFQKEVAIDSLAEDVWVGVEVITHTEEDRMNTKLDESDKNNATCPIIRIIDATHEISTTETPYYHGYNYDKRQRQYAGRGGSQTTSQQDYNRLSERNERYLKLTWSDKNKSLMYCLKYNETARGKWASAVGCKEDPMNYIYNPFNGNIQVIEALRDHLILYFCERRYGSPKFSIVLSRPTKKLSTGVIKSIHRLLKSRNMPMISVQEVCNSVSGLRSGIISLLTVILLFTWNLC